MISMAENTVVKDRVEPLELWEALKRGTVGKGSPPDMLVNSVPLLDRYKPAALALNLAYKI